MKRLILILFLLAGFCFIPISASASSASQATEVYVLYESPLYCLYGWTETVFENDYQDENNQNRNKYDYLYICLVNVEVGEVILFYKLDCNNVPNFIYISEKLLDIDGHIVLPDFDDYIELPGMPPISNI